MQEPYNQISQEKEDKIVQEKKTEIDIDKGIDINKGIVKEVLEKKLEKKEILTEKEKIIRHELLEQTSKRKLAPQLKDVEEEVKKKTEELKLKSLNQEEKIKYLLNLAQEKGVVFAVKVAQKLGDDYCLDVFHDILAKNSLYKQFKI